MTLSSLADSSEAITIEDLPPELLCHIFSLATPEYKPGVAYGKAENAGTSDQRVQLQLSLVSRKWRDVALQVPELWTIIDFTYGMRIPELYLSRSGTRPLVIVLGLAKDLKHMLPSLPPTNPCLSDHMLDYMQRALSMVLPALKRWRSFTLMAFDQNCMEAAMRSLHSCREAPLLEHLSLSIRAAEKSLEEDEEPFLPWNDCVIFDGMLPKLTHLTLRGVSIAWDTAFLTNLQSLELAYHAHEVRPDYCHFAKIIDSSPDLHTLILRSSGPAWSLFEWRESLRRDDGTIASAFISCPSLRKLVLDIKFEDDEGEMAKMTRFLGVSRLSDIEIKLPAECFCADDPEECEAVFMSELFGHNSKSLLMNVESCKLSYIGSDEWAWECYMEMPKLKRLELDADSCHPDFYRYLRIPSFAKGRELKGHGHGVFFSCLEDLVVTGLSGRQLCSVVKERKDAGYPLRRVYLNERDGVRPDRIEWLKNNLDVFEQFRHRSMPFIYDDEESDADSETKDFEWGWDEEDLESSEASSEDSWMTDRDEDPDASDSDGFGDLD